MGDFIVCHECEERYDPSGTPHACPGSNEDRLALLERSQEEFEERLGDLDEPARHLHKTFTEMLARLAEVEVLANQLEANDKALEEESDAHRAALGMNVARVATLEERINYLASDVGPTVELEKRIVAAADRIEETRAWVRSHTEALQPRIASLEQETETLRAALDHSLALGSALMKRLDELTTLVTLGFAAVEKEKADKEHFKNERPGYNNDLARMMRSVIATTEPTPAEIAEAAAQELAPWDAAREEPVEPWKAEKDPMVESAVAGVRQLKDAMASRWATGPNVLVPAEKFEELLAAIDAFDAKPDWDRRLWDAVKKARGAFR